MKRSPHNANAPAEPRASEPSEPLEPIDVRGAMNGLRRVVRALRLSDAEMSRALGLSAAQHFVLQEVAHAPGLSIGQLADLTQTDPSSVSVVVTRLEKHGLIERKPAAGDARRLEIRTTPIGLAVVRGAPQAVQVRMIEALSALTPARLRGFVATLDELARAMGIEEGSPPMFFEEAGGSGGPQATHAGRDGGAGATVDIPWAPNHQPPSAGKRSAATPRARRTTSTSGPRAPRPRSPR